MSADVIEVIARIADSVVDRAHVPAGGRYRIGTAPGVELPIAHGALRCFPLLDAGFTFRRPAGITARAWVNGHEHPIDTDARVLGRGDIVQIELGLVTITLARIERAPTPVPRPRRDKRPLAFVAGALAAHLVVLGFALRVPPAQDIPVVTVPNRPVHVKLPKQLPPPPPTPAQREKAKRARAAAASAAAASAPTAPALREDGPKDPRAKAIQGAKQAGVLGALGDKGLGDLSMLSVPLDKLKQYMADAVFYDEVEATKNQFGNSRKFNPNLGGTVKTGRYATVSSGRGAGDNYEIPGGIKHQQPDMELCPDGPCHVQGAVARDDVHHQLDLRLGAFGYCYQRFAVKKLTGTIAIEFTIGPDGNVIARRARGMPEIDECVSDVVGVITYPVTATPTRVSAAVSFRPSKPS